MTTETGEQAAPETPNHGDEEPSLASFIDSVGAQGRAVIDQFQGVGKLASMELDLAVSSFHWWVLMLALFFVTSIVAGTFLIAAILIGVTGAALSPVTAMLVMGGVSACAAAFFFFCLRHLSQKMTFRHLRKQLLPAQVPTQETSGVRTQQ